MLTCTHICVCAYIDEGSEPTATAPSANYPHQEPLSTKAPLESVLHPAVQSLSWQLPAAAPACWKASGAAHGHPGSPRRDAVTAAQPGRHLSSPPRVRGAHPGTALLQQPQPRGRADGAMPARRGCSTAARGRRHLVSRCVGAPLPGPGGGAAEGTAAAAGGGGGGAAQPAAHLSAGRREVRSPAPLPPLEGGALPAAVPAAPQRQRRVPAEVGPAQLLLSSRGRAFSSIAAALGPAPPGAPQRTSSPPTARSPPGPLRSRPPPPTAGEAGPRPLGSPSARPAGPGPASGLLTGHSAPPIPALGPALGGSILAARTHRASLPRFGSRADWLRYRPPKPNQRLHSAAAQNGAQPRTKTGEGAGAGGACARRRSLRMSPPTSSRRLAPGPAHPRPAPLRRLRLRPRERARLVGPPTPAMRTRRCGSTLILSRVLQVPPLSVSRTRFRGGRLAFGMFSAGTIEAAFLHPA